MKIAPALAAVLAVAVHAQPADFPARSKATLLHSLKDADSARLRGLYVAVGEPKESGRKVYALCGEVNAKNAYGGYVGFRRFYVSSDNETRIEDASDSLFVGWYRLHCSEKLADTP